MSGFQVTKKDMDGVLVLNLHGYLDAHTAPAFEKEIESALNSEQYRIITNLERLDYISSAGLGVYMGYIEDIRESAGDIVISNASDKVYKVFDLLGFPSIFKIVNSVDDAVTQLNSK